MRKALKLMGVVSTIVIAMAGQASADIYFNGTSYSNTPNSRSQTTQPYNEIRSELSYARYGADGTVGGGNSSYARSAYKSMERAVAYRDKGDMKNACRYATMAVGQLRRAGFDRRWEIVSAYDELQQEFCAAANS